ncbi:ABC transporter ATP-binding protein [Salipaludibacillus sp. HK11]|uniref:ABC transporter ATP-binding protein n=1 Tax=Salipaludibacillus sp. HK11 TaxID=3394320 RepID=UPI0039FCCDC5
MHALRGASVNIAYNKLIVLKGRSGSGKTTMLNLLGALDIPTEGDVFFAGENTRDMSEKEKVILRREKIGFIFQSFALVPFMSVYENIEFGLRIAGVPKEEWQEKVEYSLAFVGLSKRAKHRPSELSGGEQQRCAIARAVAHRPPLVLADEPTAELDSLMAVRVMQGFKKLVEEEKTTVVMTTHDPSIMELADQVYELEDGIIVEKNAVL